MTNALPTHTLGVRDPGYFVQLVPRVEPLLENFKKDFFTHDQRALSSFTGRFIIGVRSSGTCLIKWQADLPAPDARLKEFIELFLFRNNTWFFAGENGQVHEVTPEQARAIYERHADRGINVCA